MVIFKPIGRYVFDYNVQVSLTPAAGGISTRLFRGNSLHAPDTIVAGQPRYYDTLVGANNTNAPYNKYVVNAFRIKVFARSEATANHMFYAISAYPTVNTTAPATLAEARERPDTVVGVVSPLGSGKAMSSLVMFSKVNKILGYKDLRDVPDTQAVAGSNPADSVSVMLTCFNIDGSVANKVNFDVQLRYYSTLMRLNDVLDS